MLTAAAYFDARTDDERVIRCGANALYGRELALAAKRWRGRDARLVKPESCFLQ
jgi:hypothetical protein